MSEKSKSKVRLNGKFSEEFSIKIGVHLGAVPSLLTNHYSFEGTLKSGLPLRITWSR